MRRVGGVDVRDVVSTPSDTPASGKALLYVTSNGRVCTKDSAGTERQMVDLNSIYPVGSIYMSVNSTNPSAQFGGTWEAFGEGKMPIGVNASETDIDAAEKTGGSKWLDLSAVPPHEHTLAGLTTSGNSVDHTHTTPSHSHTSYHSMNLGVNVGSSTTRLAQGGGASSVSGSLGGNTGAGGASVTGGNNVDHVHTLPSSTGAALGAYGTSYRQPFIAVYMWKRTA